jgi:PhnB protein
MVTVNPYLTFNGNCEQAFDFYRSIFGGEFQYVGRYKDMPPSEHPVPKCEGDKIMHISLPISTETILMGSDTCCEMDGEFDSDIHFGNNISLSVNTSSIDELNRIFNGLAEGGRITMPLQKTFWDAHFGMLIDKFGINWMLNYDIPK